MTVQSVSSWGGGAVAILAATWILPVAPPPTFNFAQDVLPILQRAGCSSAYCHGSATGRAGFRLSLFGSDPAADHDAITAQFGGRRLDLLHPEQSLIVQKALGKLGHGGGRRMLPDAPATQRLLDWIAAGAPWCDEPDRELVALDVAVGAGRVAATARFRVAIESAPLREFERDVSDDALFASSDPAVVSVDAAGVLQYHGAGQAILTARFGNLTATVRIVRPFSAVVGGVLPAARTALDEAWLRHLAELGLSVGAPVSAGQLARRIYLDLVARPPTPHELTAFEAACSDADGRQRAIRDIVMGLATRREFAEVWGARLADWLEIGGGEERGPALAATVRARDALVQAIVEGVSLPGIARRVVFGQQAKGEWSAGWLERIGDAQDRAEYAGRTLLGMRIGCARCHDHPSDRWRQSEHLAFSACFASPRPDGHGGMMAGKLFVAESGQEVVPQLLALGSSGTTDLIAVRSDAPGRRTEVVEFLLSKDHDAFARNACNRLIAMLLGHGLVEPVDDHRLGNPPLAAGMLDAMVAVFHECDAQLPELLAAILSSAIYSAPLAPADTPADRAACEHFAAQASRALSAATFVRAVAAVVGRQPEEQLPTDALPRELALRNGAIVQGLLARGGTTIDATFELCATPSERVVELWRTILSRSPTDAELAHFVSVADSLPAFRDLAFALLTGREFGHRR